MTDKRFKTTIYPKNETYFSHLTAIAKAKKTPFTTLIEEIYIDWVNNNVPVTTSISQYVRDVVVRPPLPWEERKTIIYKLRQMEQAQCRQWYDQITECKGIGATILDEKERFNATR